MRNYMGWIKLVTVLAPILLLVSDRCREIGLRPTWPLAGLAVGVAIEVLGD